MEHDELSSRSIDELIDLYDKFRSEEHFNSYYGVFIDENDIFP